MIHFAAILSIKNRMQAEFWGFCVLTLRDKMQNRAKLKKNPTSKTGMSPC